MAGSILVVDDEPDVARYLAAVLEANGYQTRVVHSAESAVAAIRTQPPDLVCLDVMMPKKSGIAMYRELREDAETSTIPVLFISGAEQEEKFDFRAFLPDESVPEPDGYLEKPIDIERFLAKVRQLIEVKPSAKGGTDEG